MERVCMKENFDSLDYFMMLMMNDNNKHGLLDYTIPKDNAMLDTFNYTRLKLCPKLQYDVTLTNPADYEHGAFGKCWNFLGSLSSVLFSRKIVSLSLSMVGVIFKCFGFDSLHEPFIPYNQCYNHLKRLLRVQVRVLIDQGDWKRGFFLEKSQRKVRGLQVIKRLPRLDLHQYICLSLDFSNFSLFSCLTH